MKEELYRMTEAEMKFTEIVWETEPIRSGELVQLCLEKFEWKKSTTYTVLKKLCEQKILSNEDSVVTSMIDQESYKQRLSEQFVKKNYAGSLPGMVAAFMRQKRLSQAQIEEIEQMIEQYKMENK